MPRISLAAWVRSEFGKSPQSPAFGRWGSLFDIVKFRLGGRSRPCIPDASMEDPKSRTSVA
jgi:hypothetical protein